jgi:hypothetical protein
MREQVGGLKMIAMLLGKIVRAAVCGMWLVWEGLAGTESVHNRCVFLGRVYVAKENVAATYQREGRPRGPT